MRVVVILGALLLFSAKKQLFLCARGTGWRKKEHEERRINIYIYIDDVCDLNTAGDASRMTTTEWFRVTLCVLLLLHPSAGREEE